MTDVSHRTAFAPSAESTTHASWSGLRAPLAPWVCVAFAGGIGLAAGQALGGNVDAFEDKLLLLLRFMAGMKCLGVIAAAAVTHWRFTYPTGPRLATLYLGALATMAVAPGLIWSLGGIAIGALFFHAGLLAFLYLAWRDDDAPLARRRR